MLVRRSDKIIANAAAVKTRDKSMNTGEGQHDSCWFNLA